MDLVPTPSQVVAAAGNLAQAVLRGGLADTRPRPRTLIDEGPLREVYHYRALAEAPPHGDPVLLVTPLAAPSTCYDLRRGCSLVEHLVQGGRPAYLVEYGAVSFADRSLGMAPWVGDVLPTAIRAVSEHAGGRPVHLVGWSLGGTFALLAAADDPDLPIASVASLGAPFDVEKVPLLAPARPLPALTDGRGLASRTYRLLGGIPTPVARMAVQTAVIQRNVWQPLAKLENLDDGELLAQLEAVERFQDQMQAYPGRTFGQVYHRFVRREALSDGSFDLGERSIPMASLAVPALVFGGATDSIAPIDAVKAVMPLLTGSPDARFEIVPGGHLGMLTGRGARASTWRVLDEWVDQWSSPAAGLRSRDGRRAASSTSGSAGRAKSTSSAGRAKSRPAAKDAIGSNPSRRYGSASSRSLAR